MTEASVTGDVVAAQPSAATQQSSHESANLGDILERVLDKGLVIAGDIKVNLLDIELLTIKLRLMIVSVDTARQLGIDWWEHDSWLNSNQAALEDENRSLPRRIAEDDEDRVNRDDSRRAGSVAREIEESPPRARRR